MGLGRVGPHIGLRDDRRRAVRTSADRLRSSDTQAQIRDTQARETRQRVDQYLARLNHVEFLPLVAAASDLLNTEPINQAEALRAWLDGESVDRLRTLAFLNFFEEVAGQYNAGTLDEEAANRELVPTAVHYWEIGGWFIGRLQKNQPTAFNQWREMVSGLRLADLIADKPAS